MSLMYLTMRSAASTTRGSILKLFNPSPIAALDEFKQGYLYRATDIQGAGKGKPEWMLMQETGSESNFNQLTTLENIRGGIFHRQGLYSLQTSKESPTFSSLNFHTTPNFLVAVFIRLHPGRKAEFDRYYTEEHMNALMKVPGWRRTRRFVTTGVPENEAECVAFHDYDPENGLGGDEFKHATTTEWYKDMMVNAVMSKDRRTFELYGVV